MLPRFQHILVPVDFTEKNLTALDLVFDLAKPLQTWATLSYQVSVLCPCPVLLVK